MICSNPFQHLRPRNIRIPEFALKVLILPTVLMALPTPKLIRILSPPSDRTPAFLLLAVIFLNL
jgi:hypothetical protein